MRYRALVASFTDFELNVPKCGIGFRLFTQLERVSNVGTGALRTVNLTSHTLFEFRPRQ